MQHFANSNGISYVTAEVLVRYRLLRDQERFPYGRLQLYAGVGACPVVTYTYATIDGVGRASGYELGATRRPTRTTNALPTSPPRPVA
jgi:hypothetical protein